MHKLKQYANEVHTPVTLSKYNEKKTGPNTKQGPEEFSIQHCINI